MAKESCALSMSYSAGGLEWNASILDDRERRAVQRSHSPDHTHRFALIGGEIS
jgi:hypothetical protein